MVVAASKRALVYGCLQANTKYKHVLEFGVGVGTSMQYLVRYAPIGSEIFGFDTFEGLPEDWIGRRGRLIESKGTFSNGGVPPAIEGVRWFQGFFKDTIPEYLKIGQPLSLVHVDCDLYDSTVDVLYGINDLIMPGTTIVFDEWWFMHKDGTRKYNGHEQQVFYKWVAEKQRQFEFVEYPQRGLTMQKIVKITV